MSLVVSEEHGTITVADNGKVKQIKEITQLKNILRYFYNTRFPTKKGLGFLNLIVRHFPEKIIAVILASSLWITFGHKTEIVRRDVVVPIEYRNLASDRIIKEPKVKEVTLTLSGTEQGFGLLKPKELKVSVDTSNIKDGDNKFVLTKDLVRNNAELAVVNIDPDEISLNSYRMLPMEIPVELVTKGSPPSDIIITDMKVEPKTLTVLFPSVAPKSKAFINTEPIELDSIREKTSISAKLDVAPDIRFRDDKYPEVKVLIDAGTREAIAKD